MLKNNAEGGRCYWSNAVTKDLLCLMNERKVMEQLDGKTRRNKKVYMQLASELAKKGYNKSSDQIKLKFRTLKKDFFKTKRCNGISGAGRSTMQHYEALNELLGERPAAAVVGLDTTIVDNMCKGEMYEKFLDESFIEAEEKSVRSEKASKKKRSAVQLTLLEIAENIKESQKSVIQTIREENNSFLSEELFSFLH